MLKLARLWIWGSTETNLIEMDPEGKETNLGYPGGRLFKTLT